MQLSNEQSHSSLIRWGEFCSLFIFLPILLYLFRQEIAPYLLPIVSLLGFFCTYLLIKDHRFKRFRLINRAGFKERFHKVILLFLLLILISAVAYAWLAPESLFYLPINWPYSWLLLLIAYPLFSALPQEVIFRTFLFHRYKGIVPSKTHRIWLSSIAFGFAHIMYGNWIAVLLSALAGYCFCKTYAMSRSTLLVACEHSLWGVWIFTLGLGSYFDLSQQAI